MDIKRDAHKTLIEILKVEEGRRERKSSSSQVVLQQAVVDLIGHHADPDRLLAEITVKEEASNNGAYSDLVFGFVEKIQQEAEVMGISFYNHSATWCAGHLAHLLSHHSGSHVIHSTVRDTVVILLDTVEKFYFEQKLNRNVFIKTLQKKCQLGVEVIWTLHCRGIMPLDFYITSNLGTVEVLGRLSEGLVELCSRQAETPRHLRSHILTGCVSYLVEQAYEDYQEDDSTVKGLRKISIALLDNITKRILERMEMELELNPYEVAVQGLRDKPGALHRFATHHLTLILGHNPHLTVSEALSSHSQWTSAKTPEILRLMYTQLMLVFREEEVVKVLRQVLEEHEVNWQSLLMFVSVYLVCSSASSGLLQELVKRYLAEGLESCEMEGVITGFLLARHGCAEGPHVFMSYSQWFQEMFSDTLQNPARNRKSFTFLIKFLSDIVPFESASTLKVHLIKPPYVPAKCRPLLSDYIILIKTRLSDLKVSFEHMGISEDVTSLNQDMIEEQTNQDIEKVLKSFEKLGKVPPTIMEASIFRKPYFIGRFLPALLTPRPLPDLPDSRMKLIDALWQTNKIPVTLYNNYMKACKQESTTLLEGLLEMDDESMDELMLEPLEQLTNALTQLQQALQHDNSCSGQVSVVSEKLHLVFGSREGDIETGQKLCVTVDLGQPVVEPLSLKLADKLLDFICETCHKMACKNYAWLTQLYLVLVQHTKLLPALYVRLWDLLINQGEGLSRTHLRGLASLLLHSVTFPGSVRQLQFTRNNLTLPFHQHLLSAFTVQTKPQMHYVLSILVQYISQAIFKFEKFDVFSCGDQTAVMPVDYLRLFSYLTCRLNPAARKTQGLIAKCDVPPEGSILDISYNIHCSEQFAISWKNVKWRLEDWVALECRVQTHHDALTASQRYSYQRWFVYEVWCQDREHTCLAEELVTAVLAVHYRSGNSMDISNMRELIQETVTMATLGDDREEMVIWGCLHSWLQHGSSNPLSMQTKLSLFFNLFMELPPHLFFTDSLIKFQEKNIDKAIEQINTVLREKLCDGVHLSLPLTSYLWQGLWTLCHYGHGKSVSAVLTGCPMLSASLMMLMRPLQCQQKHCNLGTSVLTDLMDSFTRQIKTCQQLDLTSFEGHWTEGCTLYIVAQDQCWQPETVTRVTQELVARDLHLVLEAWLVFTLAHISHSYTISGEDRELQGLVSDIVKACPMLLRVLNGHCEDENILQALPPHLAHQTPVSLARVYISLSGRREWESMTREKPWLVECLVATHNACLHYYHAQSPPPTTNETLDIVCALTGVIRQILQVSTHSHLRQVSKVIVEKSDITIQALFRRYIPDFFK